MSQFSSTQSSAKEAFEEGFSHSFALQFISLILFILIFVITAHYPQLIEQSKEIVESETIPQAIIVKQLPSEKVILEKELTSEYIAADGRSLIVSGWEGIFQLLKDHDVSLVIQVAGVSILERTQKAQYLYAALIEQGVPAVALRVDTTTDETTSKLKIIEGDVQW